MTQDDRRIFLIKRLLAEFPQYSKTEIPSSENMQKRLLRSLMNVRMPKSADSEFMSVQDDYLRTAIAEKGITDLSDLAPITADGLYLWQGDITTLECGAIVNAAN